MKKTSDDDEKFPERRLTKVETELDSVVRDISVLTKDIRDLSQIVRTQGDNFESQMRQLHVALTNAAAPKKTEWGAIASAAISTIALLMGIGAAVLAPLAFRMTELQSQQYKQEMALKERLEQHKEEHEKMDAHFREHEKLELHPVGKSRIDALEKNMHSYLEENKIRTQELAAVVKSEMLLVNDGVNTKLEALRREFDDVRVQGSPVTRERLAIIENELKALAVTAAELRATPRLENRIQALEHKLLNSQRGDEQ